MSFLLLTTGDYLLLTDGASKLILNTGGGGGGARVTRSHPLGIALGVNFRVTGPV